MTNWIQAIATIVLVCITFAYTCYTKSLAQIGREPILDIGKGNALNIRYVFEIINNCDFFAKDILLTLKRQDSTTVKFSGPKVLSPKTTGYYKGIEAPFFKDFQTGDRLILECKSVLGRTTTLVYKYETGLFDLDKEIPAQFYLIDVV